MPRQKKTPTIKIPYGHQSISKADKNSVLKTLGSDFLTQGPAVKAFEDLLAKTSQTKYAVAFSSGTSALHAACWAAGVGSGDEGITSAMSFAASSNCLLYVGATPRFADIDPITAQITAKTIAKHINKKTKILIPVDYSGRVGDRVALKELADQHKLTILVDACHSLGAWYEHGGKKIPAGSCEHADMVAFSFHPVKSITTAEGGAITTNRKDLYDRLMLFRTHGIERNPEKLISKEFAGLAWYYEMQELGYNYRLSDLQASLGTSQLKTLNAKIRARASIAKIYHKELAGVVGTLPADDKTSASAHHLFPALVPSERREEIFCSLRAAGIGVQVHYLPTYRQPYYIKKFGVDPKRYPETEKFFRSTISLPIYPDLKKKNHEFVIKTLKKLITK